MKNIITGKRGGFTGMGVLAIIAGLALCLSLSACSKAEEASVEKPVVEMMDQPEDTASAPAAGEELPAADEAGDADAAAPEAEEAAGESPAAEAPADESSAAQAPAEETPAASSN